jgi:hypothetical protein
MTLPAQPVVIQDKILRHECANASTGVASLAGGVLPVREIAKELLSFGYAQTTLAAVATLPARTEVKPRKYALIRGTRKVSVAQRDESDLESRRASRQSSPGFARRGFTPLKGR